MKRLTAFIMLIAFLMTPCGVAFASEYGLSSAGDTASAGNGTGAVTDPGTDMQGEFVSSETFDAEIYADGVVLNVPLIAQIGPSCGPTSLAMCISYLNKTPLDSDWAYDLYNRIGHGTGGFAYGLKENSLAQDVYSASEMTESLLQSEIEKGHPVIVLIGGPNELSGPDGHVEVIRGYRSGRYYLNDPNLSRELTHREGISFAFNDFHQYALTYFVIRHREGEGW